MSLIIWLNYVLLFFLVYLFQDFNFSVRKFELKVTKHFSKRFENKCPQFLFGFHFNFWRNRNYLSFLAPYYFIPISRIWNNMDFDTRKCARRFNFGTDKDHGGLYLWFWGSNNQHRVWQLFWKRCLTKPSILQTMLVCLLIKSNHDYQITCVSIYFKKIEYPVYL